MIFNREEVLHLISLLDNKYTLWLDFDYKNTIASVLYRQEISDGRRIFHKFIHDKDNIYNFYQESLYGEDKYINLLVDDNRMFFSLDFYSRHLKKFIFNLPFYEVCLFINTPFLQTLAAWRLEIAK